MNEPDEEELEGQIFRTGMKVQYDRTEWLVTGLILPGEGSPKWRELIPKLKSHDVEGITLIPSWAVDLDA